MKSMYPDDTVEKNGKVYQTNGENIRNSSGDISADDISNTEVKTYLGIGE